MYMEQFAVLIRETSGIRRSGAAALDLIDVALGRLDGFWELSLAPWDVAAGTLIVREAGGIVTDADGSRDVIKHGSIVAGNTHIHEWLLEKIGPR
jgi:myo-inositol-1(or 4)-monophosphatase